MEQEFKVGTLVASSLRSHPTSSAIGVIVGVDRTNGLVSPLYRVFFPELSREKSIAYQFASCNFTVLLSIDDAVG